MRRSHYSFFEEIYKTCTQVKKTKSSGRSLKYQPKLLSREKEKYLRSSMMDTGLSSEQRQNISESLHKLLADVYATYVMTQNMHWNLTSKEFYGVHIMLEKQYEEKAEIIDELAERIRALGFYVDASLSSFQKHCSIKECKELHNAHDSLQHLLKSLELVIKHARETGNVADSARDHATVDLVGRVMNHFEKSAWMVRSSI